MSLRSNHKLIDAKRSSNDQEKFERVFCAAQDAKNGVMTELVYMQESIKLK